MGQTSLPNAPDTLDHGLQKSKCKKSAIYWVGSGSPVFIGALRWRRGSESNRRIKVLQTSPLPLGYRAILNIVPPGQTEPSPASATFRLLRLASHAKDRDFYRAACATTTFRLSP